MIIPRILLEEYMSSSKCFNSSEGVVGLVLANAWTSRSVLSNGKRPYPTFI